VRKEREGGRERQTDIVRETDREERRQMRRRKREERKERVRERGEERKRRKRERGRRERGRGEKKTDERDPEIFLSPTPPSIRDPPS
jgi:hypothetical protein